MQAYGVMLWQLLTGCQPYCYEENVDMLQIAMKVGFQGKRLRVDDHFTWPVNLKLLDLGRPPCVLYGVKYIDLVSLEVAQARQSQILTSRPFLLKWRASKIWI